MTGSPRILYCHCAYAQVVPKAVKEEVLARLTAEGIAFEAVPDLCALSAHNDPLLKQLATGEQVRIAACYPRAVKWLFSAAGAPLPPEGVEICNMRVQTAEQVVEALLEPTARRCRRPSNPRRNTSPPDHSRSWPRSKKTHDRRNCPNSAPRRALRRRRQSRVGRWPAAGARPDPARKGLSAGQRPRSRPAERFSRGGRGSARPFHGESAIAGRRHGGRRPLLFSRS